jgi:glycosyltransferase involved in cell wall biosynthesis
VKILFFGDLAQTGFGTVTLDLGPRLLALGHDVRFASQNEVGRLPDVFEGRVFQVNAPMAWNGWRPGDTEVASTAGLFDGSLWPDGWTPEAGIVLGDVVAAREAIFSDDETRAAFGSIPVFHYVPIEGVGLPPRWAELWSVVRPVAMSEFGADEIAKLTNQRPPVVYHGIDTDVFYPVTIGHQLRLEDGTRLASREECREWLKIPPKAQVMFRADTNMPRKRYPSLMRALAPVLATHPEAFLAIHARSKGQGGHLEDERSKYHPSIASRIINTGFRDLYRDVPRYMLTMLYNASDLYVSVSAEGFGLTIAEALACGTPAVVMDYSSCSELVGLEPRRPSDAPIREGSCGLAVRPVGLIDNEYNHFWAGVDEGAYGQAVARLLDDPAKRHVLGARGPYHVREAFSWDVAARQFSDLIEASVTQAVAA